MRKLLLLLVCTAVLWVPAVSMAGDSSSPATPAPKTETSPTNRGGPARICESRHSSTEADAFGKCVSTAAKHEEKRANAQGHGENGRDDDKGTESHGKHGANPARACKAMEAQDSTGFRNAYGTRRNAFGKCVAKHANGRS